MRAGEAGAEVRGDAGRAQGVQRAAAGGGGDDQMGDVRRGGHHDEVGALRLRSDRSICAVQQGTADTCIRAWCFISLSLPVLFGAHY